LVLPGGSGGSSSKSNKSLAAEIPRCSFFIDGSQLLNSRKFFNIAPVETNVPED
jgi:hypothetical protein